MDWIKIQGFISRHNLRRANPGDADADRCACMLRLQAAAPVYPLCIPARMTYYTQTLGAMLHGTDWAETHVQRAMAIERPGMLCNTSVPR